MTHARFPFRSFFAGIMAIVMILSFSVQTVQAAELNPNFDATFYSDNSVQFYDPRCLNTESEAGEIMQLAGNNNTEQILNFYMRKGLKLHQAAGIIGNMTQESGLNPAIVQGGRIISEDEDYVLQGGVGFGLVQWTSADRQKNFMNFMRASGAHVTNLAGQLEFTWKEMNEGFPGMLRALKTAKTASVAAVIVHGKSDVGSSHPDYKEAMTALAGARGYESSADNGDFVVRVRGGTATKVYEQYSDRRALAGGTADEEMKPAGEGTDADILTLKNNSNGTGDGEKNKSCEGGNAAKTGGIGALQEKTGEYAHNTYYTKNLTEQKPAYTDAVARARTDGRYVGGNNGNDCGGFVTTLIHDSGYDRRYNKSDEKGRGGYTVIQEAWLKENWHEIKAGEDREVGDVAINEDHTYIYVGKFDGWQQYDIASASLSGPQRAPMAGTESPKDPNFRWYRIGKA
ncbi:hypothetical protein EON76_01585 [bacterium]|nr:MAG: hypothetical protein EON76_01585 [bacterium]